MATLEATSEKHFHINTPSCAYLQILSLTGVVISLRTTNDRDGMKVMEK